MPRRNQRREQTQLSKDARKRLRRLHTNQQPVDLMRWNRVQRRKAA